MLVFLLLLISGVGAIPLADFYPFGIEAGDSVLLRGDDASSPPISLRFTFFGEDYDVIYVNINGNISPGMAFIYTNLDEVAVPTISPYRLDIDTRPDDGGYIWYRVTSESNLLDQALSHVQSVYPSVSSLDHLLIATWDHVGYHSLQTDQNNTFQCIVAVGSNATYAIYLYADDLIQSSRGGDALAGYSAGSNGNSSYIIPGSFSTDIERITSKTNIECPGVWVFRLDVEELVVPERETCDTAFDVNNPAVCNETNTDQQLPSYGCVKRYGSCIPFKAMNFVCDRFYEPYVDYVYVPNTRSSGSFSDLTNHFKTYGDLLLGPLEKCRDIALPILCHYYLPPCGKQKQFHPPTAVCSEQCRLTSQLCPTEWAVVVELFELNRVIIEDVGLQLIDCDFPGNHLTPLPHCCSDLALNISFFNSSNTTVGLSSDTAEVYYFIVAFPLGACAIICLIILIIWLKRRKKQRKIQRVRMEKSFETTAQNLDRVLQIRDYAHAVLSDIVQEMSENMLLIPGNCIATDVIIGEGEYGIVYRATLHGWKGHYNDKVAVKTLKGLFTSGNLKKMVQESQIMANFDHLNIMKLLGLSISKSNSVFVVMPFMAQGSLLSYLRKNRESLTVENEDMIEERSSRLLSMCLQVAKGMEYLASQKFVHRDLAARNCMIDLNNVIKVSDFGLTEDIYARNYFRQVSTQEEDGETPVKLPVKWMALESLNDGVFSERTDVWSFGVTCWEVFSLGKNPYPEVDPFSLIRYLERGERLDKPLNAACSQETYDMMNKCWEGEPWKRPNFSQLVTTISISLKEMVGYLDLLGAAEPTHKE